MKNIDCCLIFYEGKTQSQQYVLLTIDLNERKVDSNNSAQLIHVVSCQIIQIRLKADNFIWHHFFVITKQQGHSKSNRKINIALDEIGICILTRNQYYLSAEIHQSIHRYYDNTRLLLLFNTPIESCQSSCLFQSNRF